MQYVEFGKENRDVILLLHGGGLSWWNYREAAQQLSADYRVILPVLDGHCGSDRDFVSIEAAAEGLLDFVDRQLQGRLLMLGGLSLGAQVALEMLARRADLCPYALIESAMVEPSRWMHALIAPSFGSCYGLIRRRWFARLQFRYLGLKPELFEDYYRDSCGISKENMIRFLQANTLYPAKNQLKNSRARVGIYVGEKESAGMRRSARRLQQLLANSSLTVLPRMRHGEFSANCGRDYAAAVRALLQEKESMTAQ